MMKKIAILFLFFVSSCASIYTFKPMEYTNLITDYNRYLELQKNYQHLNIKTYKPNVYERYNDGKDVIVFNINEIIKNIKTADVNIIKANSLYVQKYSPSMGGSFVSSCDSWYRKYDCGNTTIFIYGLKEADNVTVYEDLALEYAGVLTYNNFSAEEKSYSANIRSSMEIESNENVGKLKENGEININEKSNTKISSHSIYSFNLFAESDDLKELEHLASSIDFKLIAKLQEACPTLPLKYDDYLDCINTTPQPTQTRHF